MYAEMARVNRAKRAALASAVGIPEAELYEIEQAAEAGNAGAQNALGECYSAAEPTDFAEAVKWFREAANQGCAMAQYNLGLAARAAKAWPKIKRKRSNGIVRPPSKACLKRNTAWL